MRPPLPPAERDTLGLNASDARALAGPTEEGERIHSSATEIRIDIDARRSHLSSHPVSLQQAWAVIAPMVTARSAWVGADSYLEQQTLVPSAGARHPLTALLLHKEEDDAQHRAWAVSPSVTPMSFSVSHRGAQTRALLDATARALRAPVAPCTVIVVLARFRRTLSKYPDGEALVWRDAGAFLTLAHLLAVSQGLHSRIVGITETTSFSLDETDDKLVDVGAIALSRKTP